MHKGGPLRKAAPQDYYNPAFDPGNTQLRQARSPANAKRLRDQPARRRPAPARGYSASSKPYFAQTFWASLFARQNSRKFSASSV